MKSYRIGLIIFLYIGFFSAVNAQSYYKGIRIDRNERDVKSFDIRNDNNYPCQVEIQYKVGSREAAWRNFSFNDLIPAGYEGTIPVGSKIYALRITYVDIIQPSLLEKAIQGFDKTAEDWVESKRRAEGQY